MPPGKLSANLSPRATVSWGEKDGRTERLGGSVALRIRAVKARCGVIFPDFFSLVSFFCWATTECSALYMEITAQKGKGADFPPPSIMDGLRAKQQKCGPN